MIIEIDFNGQFKTQIEIQEEIGSLRVLRAVDGGGQKIDCSKASVTVISKSINQHQWDTLRQGDSRPNVVFGKSVLYLDEIDRVEKLWETHTGKDGEKQKCKGFRVSYRPNGSGMAGNTMYLNQSDGQFLVSRMAGFK